MGCARLARRVVRQGAPAGPGRGRLRGVQPRRRGWPAGRPWHHARRTNDHRERQRRPEAAVHPRHARRGRSLVPAVQRARSRVRPRRLADQGGTRRRRVHRQRPEGLDVGGTGRRLRDAARPHRPGRAQAPRHQLLRAADEPAGGRGAAADPDDRRVGFQRGVLLRRAGARIRDHRGAERRVGRGAVHAGLRAHVARHRERAGVPAQRAGREQVPAAAGGLGRRVHRRLEEQRAQLRDRQHRDDGGRHWPPGHAGRRARPRARPRGAPADRAAVHARVCEQLERPAGQRRAEGRRAGGPRGLAREAHGVPGRPAVAGYRVPGRRPAGDAGRRRRAARRAAGQPDARNAGALDLRRLRPDSAQHHLRAGARPAQGGGPVADDAVPRAQNRNPGGGGVVMIFTFTDEQREPGATLRRFLQDKSPSSEVRRLMATPEGYDPQTWAQLAGQLGLQGLAIPEKYGGSGAGPVELAIVCEEMGRALLCAPYFATAVLAAHALLASGDQAAAEEFLPSLADGGTIATLAVCEDDGAWTTDGLQTTARRSGDGYRLDGRKSFVLDGHIADLLLVVAQAEAGPRLFAGPGNAAGLGRRLLETLDMTRKQAELTLDGVPARLIGAEGSAADVVRRTLRLAAVALAGEQGGGGQRCLDMSVEYAKIRMQFGRPIGSFQAIKHMCADLLLEVESARSAAYYAAWAAEEGSDELPLVSSPAKAFCSEAYFRAAADNIQIHGGIGFTWEHDAHLYYRRAKSTELMLGTPEEHREIAATYLVDGAAGS